MSYIGPGHGVSTLKSLIAETRDEAQDLNPGLFAELDRVKDLEDLGDWRRGFEAAAGYAQAEIFIYDESEGDSLPQLAEEIPVWTFSSANQQVVSFHCDGTTGHLLIRQRF